MSKLDYAKCLNIDSAKCVLFSANTKTAGTAPTYVTNEDRQLFSADAIRNVDNRLHSLPENFKTGEHLFDDGNLSLNNLNQNEEISALANKFKQIINNNQVPICLGGDHIIKTGALNSLNQLLPNQYGVIYLDAHPDCEKTPNLSYASILHHAFLQGLNPTQVMLTGIRQLTEPEAIALTSHQPDIGLIRGSDFSKFTIHELRQQITAQFKGLKYLYFSIDLDGLQPACAPAVESPYPGGPNINQVILLIQMLREHFEYVGMDISEFVPALDQQHLTALSAARLMKEFYSVI